MTSPYDQVLGDSQAVTVPRPDDLGWAVVGGPAWCPVAAPTTGTSSLVVETPVEGSLRASPPPSGTRRTRGPARSGAARAGGRGGSPPKAPATTAYDGALGEPGDTVAHDPTAYAPPPEPAPQSTAGPVTDTTEQDRAEDERTTAAAAASTRTTTEALGRLAADLLDMASWQETLMAPDPNRALASAVESLHRPAAVPSLSSLAGLRVLSALANPVGRAQASLLGAAGETAVSAIDRVAASSTTDSLGADYLIGVAQGLVSGALEMAAGAGEVMADPVGSTLHQVATFMDQVRARTAQGEPTWRAVLGATPPGQFVEAFGKADGLARDALTAAAAGRRVEARQLARRAGMAAAGGGLAASQTYMMAEGGLRAAARLGRGWRSSPAPDLGRAPLDPETSTTTDPANPSSLTGTVEPAERSSSLRPRRRVGTPHPAYPTVQVFAREYVVRVRDLYEQVLRARAAEFARANPGWTAAKGKEASRLVLERKSILNAAEVKAALKDALAHPRDGFVLQARLVEVVEADGSATPVEDINAGYEEPGRIIDYVRIEPNGTLWSMETKWWTTLLKSLGRAGVKSSSDLGTQIAKEGNVFDYAKARPGSRVRVRGQLLDGSAVEVLLDPTAYRGSTPAPYQDPFVN